MKKICPVSILFEPDGYVTTGVELVGRQMAGYGFLRATVEECDPGQNFLSVFTASKRSSEVFSQLVSDIKPDLETVWTRADDLEALAQIGTLYLADPNLDRAAHSRLRVGSDAYSLVGVTHTTATHAIMDMVKNLWMAPVFPWDALVCTSQSVKDMVEKVLEAQLEYIAWRLGPSARPPRCKLPVIPLGVHSEDFAYNETKRSLARQRFELAEDEIVFLYVGRFSPYTKAHPLPMYAGLQSVSERTGKKVTLIECGWHAGDQVEAMVRECREAVCPNVRCIEVDGRNQEDKRLCLSAADVFVSLSDNIQETFGLTPVEAMAAGLPILVSEWDGYKELLEDGVQGFKIPTYMAHDTDRYAAWYDGGMVYGRYCASVSQITAVDARIFVDRAVQLVENPTLRRDMGVRGQIHARETYSWTEVHRQYRQLWAELAEIRHSTKMQDFVRYGPGVSPARQAPSTIFRSYPTILVDYETPYRLLNRNAADYLTLRIMDIGREPMPKAPLVSSVLENLATVEATTVRQMANQLGLPEQDIQRTLNILHKAGAVEVAS